MHPQEAPRRGSSATPHKAADEDGAKLAEISKPQGYISTRVTTPCILLAGNLLNCTKFGVNFLMTEKIRQMGL